MPLPERELIAQIRRMVRNDGRSQADKGVGWTRAALLAGIGDDCAVLRFPAGSDSLITTDLSLEGVHFRRAWHPAESVGHRCLTRGLSDIAAMGGAPAAVFLSLALPRNVPQAWVGRFVRSLARLAKKHGAILAGGDTAESPKGILADVMVVGTMPKGKAILRSGAQVGDRIFVSGALGGSAAAVAQMMARPKRRLKAGDYRRHFFPEARLEVGRGLRDKGLATAMIDTSDGLSVDLAHICEESGVGAEVDAARVPRAKIGRPAREVDLDVALHGGEDYELLFTVPAGKLVPRRIEGVALTEIGRIVRSRKIWVRDLDGVRRELRPLGWEHFRG